jgi:hypothetical protein
MARWTAENHPHSHRPKGSRNRLAKDVLDDLISIWNEPMRPDSDIRRGPAALRIMSKERPADFCKLYSNLMPREFLFEHATFTEVEEVDRVIEAIRERIALASHERLEAPQMKVISHEPASR